MRGREGKNIYEDLAQGSLFLRPLPITPKRGAAGAAEDETAAGRITAGPCQFGGGKAEAAEYGGADVEALAKAVLDGPATTEAIGAAKVEGGMKTELPAEYDVDTGGGEGE